MGGQERRVRLGGMNAFLVRSDANRQGQAVVC